MLIAAERGFSFADPFAVLIVFAGLALFAAVVALTRESEHAFTSAIVYLVLGAAAALLLDVLGATSTWRSSRSSSRSSAPA